MAPVATVAVLAVGGLLGCKASTYEAEANRVGNSILLTSTEQVLGDREQTVVYPDKLVPSVPDVEQEVDETAEALEAPPDPNARVLSLSDALEIAIRTNRDYISQVESLFLTALSLGGTRHSFTPLVNSALSYTFSGGEDVSDGSGSSLGFGLSQILPWGGSASADIGLSHANDVGGESYSSSAGVRLTQPLLRGAGRERSHEALVQAERNMIYAIRSFELFREGFSIDVARRFYDLVQQKQGLDNQRRSLERIVVLRRQAEARNRIGDMSEIEVLRARRDELQSQNALLQVEEDQQLALDQFRIFLGLPESVRVDVLDEEPVFQPIEYEVDSAVQVAFANRLDYLTRKQQLDDSARGLRFSRDDLRPDLDLSLSYNLGGRSGDSFSSQALNRDSYSAGITLDIPIDQVNERNAYRSAQIGHAREIRQFEEFEENLVVGVRSSFRTLERQRLSVEIQRELIDDQERAVRVEELRFERGEVSNRDVLESQEDLLEAKNTLIREKVNYEIGRLNLLRDLGILFIDEKGMWTE